MEGEAVKGIWEGLKERKNRRGMRDNEGRSDEGERRGEKRCVREKDKKRGT